MPVHHILVTTHILACFTPASDLVYKAHGMLLLKYSSIFSTFPGFFDPTTVRLSEMELETEVAKTSPYAITSDPMDRSMKFITIKECV
jgi:hypothetical protein